MNTHKIALGTFATAALVLGGTGAAHAGTPAAAGTSAAAAGSLCEIRVTSVRAVDIQEDNQGSDEIRVRLGDKRSDTRSFTPGQKRNFTTTDVFTSSEAVKVVEVDANKTNVIGSASIPCVARTSASLVSDASGDTIYRVRWNVDVLVP